MQIAVFIPQVHCLADFKMMGIFGRDKKVDTKEAVRELQRKMRIELRQLDRQVHAIEREEMKVSFLTRNSIPPLLEFFVPEIWIRWILGPKNGVQAKRVDPVFNAHFRFFFIG